jgi:hypothetical protein
MTSLLETSTSDQKAGASSFLIDIGRAAMNGSKRSTPFYWSVHRADLEESVYGFAVRREVAVGVLPSSLVAVCSPAVSAIALPT